MLQSALLGAFGTRACNSSSVIAGTPTSNVSEVAMGTNSLDKEALMLSVKL